MDEQLDIEQVRRDVAARANEIIGQAVEFAREKPHAAVGIALGIGWVLGNGLHPRVIGAAARIGWKALIGGAMAGGGVTSMLSGLMGQQQGEEPAMAQGGGEGGSRQAVRSSAPRGGGASGGSSRSRGSSSTASKE